MKNDMRYEWASDWPKYTGYQAIYSYSRRYFRPFINSQAALFVHVTTRILTSPRTATSPPAETLYDLLEMNMEIFLYNIGTAFTIYFFIMRAW